MPSEAHARIAAHARFLAAHGRYHGKASELVETFSVPFTVEGIQQVDDALASQGLVAKPKRSVDAPKAHVTVTIVGGSAVNVAVRVDAIEIFAGEPGRPYTTLGPVRARVTAATVFSKTPTVEDVNLKLREQAVRIGANAVINVSHARGVSATSWKALTANGTAVLADAAAPAPPGTLAGRPDPVEQLRQLSELHEAGAITTEEFTAAKQETAGIDLGDHDGQAPSTVPRLAVWVVTHRWRIASPRPGARREIDRPTRGLRGDHSANAAPSSARPPTREPTGPGRVANWVYADLSHGW